MVDAYVMRLTGAEAAALGLFERLWQLDFIDIALR